MQTSSPRAFSCRPAVAALVIGAAVVLSSVAGCSQQGNALPPPSPAAAAPPAQSAQTTPVAQADTDVCDAWPAGTAPAEIGKRVAENFAVRPLGDGEMHYAQACAWLGALRVAAAIGDDDLAARLVRRFDPVLTPAGAGLVPSRNHVDDRVFGVVPLELARRHASGRYLSLGLSLADAQWASPTPDGITSEARYWIDDMYMITALQAQAFRATRDTKYLDRAAFTLTRYLAKLQQQDGLFHHTAASPVRWGRGNGWVASGMTELMLVLPPEHPEYAAVRRGYLAMMRALLRHQAADGLWRQIIDDSEAWPETSSSAMFTYAMVAGVKRGWLDRATYRPAACRAWLGVIRYLDDSGNLGEVCVGTGDAASQGISGDAGAQRQYYLDRPRHVGDFHGQAPILWTAAMLLE